jgi:hypothetical protein
MNKAAREAQHRFVLDANVFIQSHRDHYAFDIVPGFWKCLLEQHDAGTLVSIDRVKDEVLAGGKDDALEDWVKKSAPKTLFASTKDAKVAKAYGEMMNWVQASAHYTDVAKRIFAANADGWPHTPRSTDSCSSHMKNSMQRRKKKYLCRMSASSSTWNASFHLKCCAG